MDEDNLFDFEDDFLLFQDNPATQKETTSKTTNIEQILSIILECFDEDSIKSPFSEKGFIASGELDTLFYDNHHTLPEKIDLFDFTIDEDFLLDEDNFLVLGNIAHMNIQKLYALSSSNPSEFTTDKSVAEIRRNVSKFFFLLRCFYKEFNQEVLLKILNSVRQSFGAFDSIPNFSVIHSAHGGSENKNFSAQCYLLHGNLEWRWILLTTLLKIERSNGVESLKGTEFENELRLLIYDLITLSFSKFNKCHISNLIFSSPFSCVCVKECWYLIQQLILKLGDDVSSFWCYFNNIVQHLKDGTNLYSTIPGKVIFLRTSTNFSCKNHTLFSIRLLCGLVKVNGFNLQGVFSGSDTSTSQENYELLESLIKTYLKDDQSEENMRGLLFIISDILTDWWIPKSDILMILWEYFQKKINSNFFIAGQNLNSLAVSSNTAVGYLEQIKDLQNSTNKLNINNSSYTMFVQILGKVVNKFTDAGQKVQIQKIFGRILSKFPSAKLLQLNEMGIYNIMKLFLTIAISTDLKEIGQKIADVMLQMPLDKIPQQQRQIAVTKGHMALLILFMENNINVTQYLTKFLNQLNLLTEKSDAGCSATLKIIAEGLQEIFLKNENCNFENGEDLFIDSWIIKYLNCSSSAEQDRMFETLSQIILKVRLSHSNFMETDNESLANLIGKFHKIMLPYVKQNFSKNGSVWFPELTANLCLLAGTNTQVSPKFEELFKYFIELNCQSIENSIRFLVVIIGSDYIHKVDKNQIIQQWIKYSVLLSGNNKDLKTLTKNLMNLQEFRYVCSSCVENPDKFLETKEPLAIFISDVGKKYQTLSSNSEKQIILEKFHSYFSSFDKWALQYVQQYQMSQTSQSQKSKDQKLQPNQEIIMRIYTIIALIIMHCSSIIYIRSKSSCFFNILISQFILPCSVMMGKPQPTILVAAIAKIWHVLFEGISRLDFRNDPNLNKNLSDLIVKWTPQFRMENSKAVARPFIAVMNLRNKDVINFLWEKLGKFFITLQNRQPNPHTCLVLTVIEEVLHVVEGDEEKLLIILRQTLPHLMEHAMMSEDIVPSKAIVYRLLERFLQNKNFENNNEMKQLFVVNLKTMTSKHLSYYSSFYFKFMYKIVRVHPGIVKEVMDFLSNQILRVEQLRGSGRDMKLRTSYDKLQDAVKSAIDKKQ